MSSPIINTEGTRSSSSSSNSYGSAIDSTARSMEVHIASSIAQSTSHLCKRRLRPACGSASHIFCTQKIRKLVSPPPS